MSATEMTPRGQDDPRKLRALLDRATDLARSHSVPCVVVGLACEEGDFHFPPFVEFLESALRVEDGIFRMTRERAVLVLADIDATRGRQVLDRLTEEYRNELSAVDNPPFEIRLVDVPKDCAHLTVKEVLTAIFSPETNERLH